MANDCSCDYLVKFYFSDFLKIVLPVIINCPLSNFLKQNKTNPRPAAEQPTYSEYKVVEGVLVDVLDLVLQRERVVGQGEDVTQVSHVGGAGEP